MPVCFLKRNKNVLDESGGNEWREGREETIIRNIVLKSIFNKKKKIKKVIFLPPLLWDCITAALVCLGFWRDLYDLIFVFKFKSIVHDSLNYKGSRLPFMVESLLSMNASLICPIYSIPLCDSLIEPHIYSYSKLLTSMFNCMILIDCGRTSFSIPSVLKIDILIVIIAKKYIF